MPARDETRHLEPPPERLGERVDSWLASAWPDLSRARIQGLIGQGRLMCDEAPVKAASEKVRRGRYALTLPPPAPAAPAPESIPLVIVFEDEHLLVIDKQAGLAMHPAPGAMTSTLVNAVLHHAGASLSGIGGVARPGIVHRIDKDTTGLVVVAKSDAAHAGLAKQFAAHRLERAYLAITRSSPHPRSGIIDTRLARSPADRRKMAVVRAPASEAGKHAITHYWTIEAFGQSEGASAGHAAAAFVECRLETGRTHQIRAHLAHIGAPLVGDQVYGKFRGLKIAGAGPRVEAARDAVRDFPRQALHAAVLGFIHPVTGASMRFEAPLPADMQALLAILRAL
jgi:23S rRNA pseudouridine1911/1915/1917 synthase